MLEKILKLNLYCILAIFFFSTIEVLGKIVGNPISPYALTAWRLLIGGLFLIIYGEKGMLMTSKSLVMGILFGIGAAVTFAIYKV